MVDDTITPFDHKKTHVGYLVIFILFRRTLQFSPFNSYNLVSDIKTKKHPTSTKSIFYLILQIHHITIENKNSTQKPDCTLELANENNCARNQQVLIHFEIF